MFATVLADLRASAAGMSTAMEVVIAACGGRGVAWSPALVRQALLEVAKGRQVAAQFRGGTRREGAACAGQGVRARGRSRADPQSADGGARRSACGLPRRQSGGARLPRRQGHRQLHPRTAALPPARDRRVALEVVELSDQPAQQASLLFIATAGPGAGVSVLTSP